VEHWASCDSRPPPTQARRCDCGARAGCGSPRQSGRWDCGARGKLPARQTRLPRPQDCRTQVGLSPPTNCILIQEMGLWNTGQAVAPGPTCWAPPTPGDGVVEHRPGIPPADCALMGRLGCGVRGGLCPRQAARPLSGDVIVEHGASCDSRPDMLESRFPQEI